MNKTVVADNERSVVIDIISHINGFLCNKDLLIKKAGGESTVFNNRTHMFPDMILYGDKSKNTILQGWEFKMPDVPIEDIDFINDACRKAKSLNLNSFVLWNFTYTVLYVRHGEEFIKEKTWNTTSFIKTRRDVTKYEEKWMTNLDEIIVEVNKYLISGTIHKTFVADAIGKSTLSSFVLRNKEELSELLNEKAKSDSVMEANISTWWLGVKTEYSKDEPDAFHAYSKRVLLNWASRLVFAHLIKYKQQKAFEITKLVSLRTAKEANKLFAKISSYCDFANVFGSLKYDDILPDSTWRDLLELAFFLNEHDFKSFDNSIFQDILESTIDSYRREINGQFCTPKELATILAELTIKDWSKDIYDCCCGTGTIPKYVLAKKKVRFGVKSAFETTWASDKYEYPLQIANISLADPDAINLPARLFKHNALYYASNEKISFVNPKTGLMEAVKIPRFHAIISNLPFVHFESIPDDDKHIISEEFKSQFLSGKSDLSHYIPFSVRDLLDDDGSIGIILSNSWLGTNAGLCFFRRIANQFSMEGIHISGTKRWFDNADVVTTLLILRNKKGQSDTAIPFYLWQKDLDELERNKDEEKLLINSAILKQELNPMIVRQSLYCLEDIYSLQKLGLSLNALFHNVGWVLKIEKKLVSLGDLFCVFRGSRRGWDKLFYPKEGEQRIESRYLCPVLLNGRNVKKFDSEADGIAFCCHDSIDLMKAENRVGALEWISRFEDQNNGTGQPLSKILKTSKLMWYEMSDKEKASFFTLMNPDERLFFGAFKEPTFINQRLIGLNKKESITFSGDLLLALLNSILTMFFIEGSGFGRGLGVLDINKDSISKIKILNPRLISENDRAKITSLFNRLRNREFKNVLDELNSTDRLDFERAVFSAFGISEYLNEVIESLKSLIITRKNVKE